MPAHKLTDDMTWEQIVEKTTLETTSDKSFSDWMLQRKHLGGYFFDPHTWKHCYKIGDKINHKNGDLFCICSGKEGSGKSTLSMQLASVVDPSFNKTQMFNSRLALIQWIKNNIGNTTGKALVIDEGNLVLFGRESLSAGSIEIVKLLTLVRQCNLFLIVNVPSYPSIDSYIRKHRVDSLFLINQARKTFRHYSKQGISVINEALRKGVEMSQIFVHDHLYYSGYWNKFLPNNIQEADYKTVKLDALKEFLSQSENNLKETKDIERVLIPTPEAVALTGKTANSIIELIKNGVIKGKKIGQRWYINKESLLNCGENMPAPARSSIHYTMESKRVENNTNIDSVDKNDTNIEQRDSSIGIINPIEMPDELKRKEEPLSYEVRLKE